MQICIPTGSLSKNHDLQRAEFTTNPQVQYTHVHCLLESSPTKALEHGQPSMMLPVQAGTLERGWDEYPSQMRMVCSLTGTCMSALAAAGPMR